MSTKFGLLIDFDVLKTVTSTNTKPELVFSGRGRHLEKWKWRHISAVGAPVNVLRVLLRKGWLLFNHAQRTSLSVAIAPSTSVSESREAAAVAEDEKYVLWDAGICPIAEILRKTACPRKISLKSDNWLLSYGQNDFQYGGPPPSWIVKFL